MVKYVYTSIFKVEETKYEMRVEGTYSFANLSKIVLPEATEIPPAFPSNPDEPISTEEEWEKAVGSSGNYSVMYEIKGQGRQYYTTVDGVIRIEYEGKEPEFYTEENGKYYFYYCENGLYQKAQVSTEEYQGASNANNIALIFDLSDMVYDPETLVYFCPEKVYEDSFGKTIYRSTSIHIESGRVVYVYSIQEYEIGGSTEIVEMTMFFNYDDIGEIELPSVGGPQNPEQSETSGPIASQEEWASLVTVVDNYKAYYSVVVDGEQEEEIFTCINGVLCLEIVGDKCEYYAEEEGKYYKYYQDETVWLKKEVDQYEYLGILNSNNLAPLFELAEMTYMSADGTDVYYCAEKDWYGAKYIDTYIIFQNGQFIGFSCTQKVPVSENEYLTVEMQAMFTFDDLGEIILPDVA